MFARLNRCHVLQNWLVSRGSFISEKLECFLAENKKEIGVRTTQNISQFEILAKIPLRLSIYEQILKLDDEENIAASDNDSEVRWKIVQKLLRERSKGKRSFYYPYLSTLPNKLANLPLFWPEQKLNLIKGTSLEIMASTEKRLLLREFEEKCPLNQSLHEKDLYLWSTGIMKSRVKQMNEHIAMVPFLDLINHTDLYTEVWGSTRGCVIILDQLPNDSELTYYLVALDDIPANQEILVDYSLLAFQNKINDYGVIDVTSDVFKKYYILAFQNFQDRHNPLLLALWDKNISLILYTMVQEGCSFSSLRQMLDSRADDLEKVCEDSFGIDRPLRFIRETDLMYTKYISINLEKIANKELAEQNYKYELDEDAQKKGFMTLFYQKTGLKIEI